MRSTVAALLLLAPLGCTSGPPYAGLAPMGETVSCQNPVFLPDSNHERVWETVVDVIDDYFKIELEEPVRQIGPVLTEGRLNTFPKVGATLLEPWHGDSVGTAERLESTLQSIRRNAEVKVTPDKGGYWVEVAVFKELEEVTEPTFASAGAATFRNDASLTRVVSPVGEQEINDGWIPLGRDAALEQRIVGQLQSRLTGRVGQMSPPAAVYY